MVRRRQAARLAAARHLPEQYRLVERAGANALDARQQLGPGWQDAVNKTTWTCWN
jgi:hypothetical protein